MNGRTGGPAILAWIGGGLLIFGSVMPWATISAGILSVSKAGTDGDGKITLVLGLLILAAGAMLWGQQPRGRTLAVTLGVIALGLGVLEYQNVAGVIAKLDTGISGSVGTGLWLVLVGAVLSAASGFWQPSAAQEQQQDSGQDR